MSVVEPISDGVLTLRTLGPADLEQQLTAVDDAQMDWLWSPGDREQFEARTPADQQAGMLAYLEWCAIANGPKWVFAGDLVEQSYVVYVDCDLANRETPGEANISYTCHPAYRGRGLTSRAVRLVCSFLREHTDVSEAHLVIHQDNGPSLRVARSVGAPEVERYVDQHGRPMIRHVLQL